MICTCTQQPSKAYCSPSANICLFFSGLRHLFVCLWPRPSCHCSACRHWRCENAKQYFWKSISFSSWSHIFCRLSIFWDISSLDHLLCNFSHSLPFSDHMRSALVSFNSGRTTSLPSLPHFFLLLLFLFSSSTVCTWTQCLLVATIPLLDQINFSNLFPISPLLELDLWECLYSLSSCMKMGPGWHPSKLPRVFLLLLSIETECSKFPLTNGPLKNISILSWDIYVSGGGHFHWYNCERGKSRIFAEWGNPRRRRIVKLVLWVQISLLDCTGRWPSSTEVEVTQAWSSGGQLEGGFIAQKNNHQYQCNVHICEVVRK